MVFHCGKRPLGRAGSIGRRETRLGVLKKRNHAGKFRPEPLKERRVLSTQKKGDKREKRGLRMP